MQPALYKYLALCKKLEVPGIGNFTVEETPATLQFTDKQWQPPASRIRFAPLVRPTNNHFYGFLSKEWNVDKVVAIRRYKEDVEAMLDELKRVGMCEWKDVGILRKTADGSLAFAAAEPSFSLFSSLPAERVLRKYSQHTVLVGEQEHIKEYVMPEQGEEMMIEEEPAKEKWKLYALILAVIAVLLIVLYYATKSNS